MNLNRLISILTFCLSSITALAQNAHFSQQYASKLYLNPAFAGVGQEWGVSLTHRNQWPALNGSFTTNQLAADFALQNTKSAVSMLIQQDRAGIGGLQKWQLSGGYAYKTPVTDKWGLALGLQATVGRLTINYDNLVFGDQLSDRGQVAITSAEANRFEPATFYTFAVGGLVFSEQTWFSLKVGNLNKPAYGFNDDSNLPISYIANTGYKFYAQAYYERDKLIEMSFTPSLTYTRQYNFNRLDVGLHTIYTPLTLGIVYRGLPVITDTNQDQQISVIAGLQLQGFNVGFSHDIGLSGISKQAGGANEITLVFNQLDFNRIGRSRAGNKLNKSVPCPAF